MPNPIISKMIGFISTASHAMPIKYQHYHQSVAGGRTGVDYEFGNNLNVVSNSWLLELREHFLLSQLILAIVHLHDRVLRLSFIS
jgi:hypothetical protein